MPFRRILGVTDNTANYSTPFSNTRFIGESTLFYNFKLASAGLFVINSVGHWNFGLNIGILLFNPNFLS